MNALRLDTADLVTIAVFLAVVLGTAAYHAVKALIANSPRARLHERALIATASQRPSEPAAPPPSDTLKTSLAPGDTLLSRLLHKWRLRILHMGGARALNWIVAGAVSVPLVSGAIVVLLGGPFWLAAALAPPGAALGMAIAVNRLTAHYRAKFLERFPDALDVLIRAVRAGIPVVQAMRLVGSELPGPVSREFRLIGDALRLGQDQGDVMTAAAERIGLPDFHFLTVCLQLQRETGGPMAETLENLASIIRTRREVQLKTRALSAQGRMSSKIIAMVPVVTMGALQFIGDHYLDVLFDTPTGHKILWIAGAMVLLGLVVINRMARMES